MFWFDTCFVVVDLILFVWCLGVSCCVGFAVVFCWLSRRLLIVFVGVYAIIVLVDFFCLVFIVFNLWILLEFCRLLVYS